MGILLTYDITDEASFANIKEKYMQNIEQYAQSNVSKILLGNKCDMEDKRVVATERGKELAESLGVPFLETSAKDNTNIEEAFIKIAQDVKTRLFDSQDSNSGVNDGCSAVSKGAKKKDCALQ